MPSLYNLTSADLTPDPIPTAQFAQLTGDACSVDTVIAKAESEFNAHLLGMMRTAANIALARPFVIDVAVFGLHFRRSQNADYIIPDGVTNRYNKALAWADGRGGDLLAAEGIDGTPNKSGCSYSAPQPKMTMDELDTL